MNPTGTLAVDPYEKLADNIYIVCKGYFAMSRRLKAHERIAQWTLSLLSLGLIIIPLLTVCKIPVRYEQNVVDFASIALAVAVLMFTLLISANNHAVRSERAHDCGLELNDMLREMRASAKDANRMSLYKTFDDRYSDILKRYENYDDIDYAQAKLRIARDHPVSKTVYWTYWSRYFGNLFIYAIALVLEFGFITLLVIPKPANKAPEPTPTAVTAPAAQEPRQP